MCDCWQNGTLKIVDRKKHIFKLAQGEYIAPEKIENVYVRSEALAQVYVHGDSLQVGRGFSPVFLSECRLSPDLCSLRDFSKFCLQAALVAVVVPDPDFLSGWAKKTLELQGSYKELCAKAVMLVKVL